MVKQDSVYFFFYSFNLTIDALQRGTFIHFLLTVEPSVACRTLAYVTVPIVPLFALATVKAGSMCAGQRPFFTVFAFKPSRAHTPIAILRVLRGEKDIKFIKKLPVRCFVLSYPVHDCPSEPHYPRFEFYLQTTLCELGHLLT